MRRLLVWLLAALLVAPGTEALATATPTYSGEWAITPDVFVDEVLLGIPKGQGRRRTWKRVRDRVLEAYAPAGLDVLVREQAPVARPTFPSTLPDGRVIESQDLNLIQQGQIVAHLTPSTSYGVVKDVLAPTAGLVGLQRLSRSRLLPGRAMRRYRPVLAHELGHALGLAHSQDPASVMNEAGFVSGPGLPSAGDLEALLGPTSGFPDPGDPGYRPPATRRRRHR